MSFKSILLPLAAALCVPFAIDLSDAPGCIESDTLTTPAHYVWGGELRQLHQREYDSTVRRWACGDGGMLRRQIDDGDWEFLNTPEDARQTLLDVYFLPDGSGEGWACGVGGTLLHLTSWGSSICLMDTVLDSEGPSPATLWRVRFVDSDIGYVCGLDTLKVTFNGGDDWYDAELPGGYETDEMEFYCMDVVGDTDGWIVLAGGESKQTGRGTVFRLSTSLWYDPAWTIAYEEPLSPSTGEAIHEVWDLEFERDPADYEAAFVLMCGGGTALPPFLTDSGAVFSSADSGESWTLELGGVPEPGVTTQYGLAVLSDGHAVSCGYGGQIYWRTAGSPATWAACDDPGFTAPLTGACQTLDGEDDVLVCGSFGFLRRSSNEGADWNDENVHSAHALVDHARAQDIAFTDDDSDFCNAIGLYVAQGHTIQRSTDGGCTWECVFGGLGTEAPQSILRSVAFSSDGQVAIAVGEHSDPGISACDYSFAYCSRDAGATWTPSGLSSLSPGWDFNLTDVEIIEDEAWAVGTKPGIGSDVPVILYSDSGGSGWVEITPVSGALASSFRPVKLAFFHPGEGVLIGNDGTNGPGAHLFEWDSADLTLTALHVPDDPLEFNDVAVGGAEYADGEVLIVGGGDDGSALILRSEDGASLAAETLPNYPFPLASVAIAPGSPMTALVGMKQKQTQDTSLDLGQVLSGEFDGDDWEWTPEKSLTNKRVQSICLLAPHRGWYMSHMVNGGPYAEDHDFGTLNDTTIFYWDND